MTLFIICCSLFVAVLMLIFIGIFTGCDEKTFFILLILLVIFGVSTIASAVYAKQDVEAIEYPASKYTFKTKVVEFEEHRDTILVVTPKEK